MSRGNLKRTIALMLFAMAALTASWSPAVSAAATYDVEVCTATASGDGLVYPESAPGGIVESKCGEAAAGQIVVGVPGNAHPPLGALRSWMLSAPPGTNIARVSYSGPVVRVFSGSNFSLLSWVVRAEGRTIEDVRDDGLFFPDNVGKTLQPHTHTLEAGLSCVHSDPCGLGGSLQVTTSGLTASLEDEFIPGFSGAKFPPAVAHGNLALGIVGEDQGGGIAKIELKIDDQTAATVVDGNGGKCGTPPYKVLLPCKLTVPASFPLNTATLKDGQHQMQYVITDAAGLKKETAPLPFLVHNSPLVVTRPAIEGANRLGSLLKATSGAWDNQPTRFQYQWFRCPAAVRGEGADVEACRAIAGANAAQYTASPEDVQQRLLVKVTAANATGSEASLSLPTDVIQPPSTPPPPPHKGKKPKLSHLTLSRKHFRVGTTLTKAQRGAVLGFSCNVPGQLTLAIEQPVRHGKKPKVIGKLAAKIKAGRSKILLTGEVGKRRLAPGAYGLTLRVRSASGAVSKPASIHFSILPG
jgi:hypothetical protein